jgi:hypothetical protein
MINVQLLARHKICVMDKMPDVDLRRATELGKGG